MKVTNPTGEQYPIAGESFRMRYEATVKPGIFAPVPAPIRVLPVAENVQFGAPWGEVMRIRAVGVLATTGPGNVYGIREEEFAETYAYVT